MYKTSSNRRNFSFFSSACHGRLSSLDLGRPVIVSVIICFGDNGRQHHRRSVIICCNTIHLILVNYFKIMDRSAGVVCFTSLDNTEQTNKCEFSLKNSALMTC